MIVWPYRDLGDTHTISIHSTIAALTPVCLLYGHQPIPGACAPSRPSTNCVATTVSRDTRNVWRHVFVMASCQWHGLMMNVVPLAELTVGYRGSHMYRVSQKWPSMLFAKISITNDTFSAKFYTPMYSTKIGLRTRWPFLVFNFKVYRVW